MTNNKKNKTTYDKQLTIWLVLGFLLVTLCFSWYSFSSCVNQLEASSQGHSLVDYLNASVQRLVKLEIMGTQGDELVFNLDNTIAELKPENGKASEYFGNHDEILKSISNVSSDWEVVKIDLTDYRENSESSALIASSERLFYHAANLTNLTSDYISELSVSILRMQMLIILQMIVVACIIGHRLFFIIMELKRNRELSESMFIDGATGLYNRSKCHEILRTAIGGDYSRAMIVFDLNDLKKTNDIYGHRVGDELIHSFAQIMKDGTKIHTQDVFVGRYGGDEFMVYYHNLELKDIQLYLKEVAFLAEAFNEKETRFQISYAAGYAVSSMHDKDITLRELFDIADQDMYRNKAEIKKLQSTTKPSPAYGMPKERL
ncbi:GGDEF domain-containing protein [Chakrabartyella piscis]|uniref:GGDEF domain-containing protein n=1 Tax=Chakrabartyella piscis TaxID=2918914 RepID=UPI00295871A7|nr:GGDEF domain-containing protein [Chakrabartyella piscis]